MRARSLRLDRSNAYGTSKLMTEWMLRDVAAVNPLRYVALRYFNVAGSDPSGRIGQTTPGATLLTKVACEAMVGTRTHISIFGTDYPTPDGTGVRDYLHVEDLASAHLRALDYLRAGGRPVTLNVGYGHGYSVREVLSMVEAVGGKKLDIREEPRRAGDPAYLVARAERIRAELGLGAALRPFGDDRVVLAGLGAKAAAGALGAGMTFDGSCLVAEGPMNSCILPPSLSGKAGALTIVTSWIKISALLFVSTVVFARLQRANTRRWAECLPAVEPRTRNGAADRACVDPRGRADSQAADSRRAGQAGAPPRLARWTSISAKR